MPPIPKTTIEIEIEKNIILENALKLIATSGVESLTMRAIAKECNSSPTKIYYYFKNKEHILFQLQEFGFTKLTQQIENSFKICSNPEEKFIAMLDTIYSFGVNDSDFFNLMFGVNLPRFLDYVNDSSLKEAAINEKNKALDFLKVLCETVKTFGDSLNKSVNDAYAVAIFTQILGVLQLHLANIYQEINMEPKNIYDMVVDSILFSFKNNKI